MVMLSDRRVVVTGIGCRTPIGNSESEIKDSLVNLRTGIQTLPDWGDVANLRPRVGGACGDLNETSIDRKHRRSMGRVAILAALASEDAIANANLTRERVASEDCGVSFGSNSTSFDSMMFFFGSIRDNGGMMGLQTSNYLKFMSHTCAANLGSMFKTRGPVYASCTACVAGSQSIGLAYDAVRLGRAKIMLAGGADELHYAVAGVFDGLRAASSGYNDRPDETPRPFDVNRDGLVVGEAGACLIVEDYEHARQRNAPILAEILGFGTNCDGAHLTRPDATGMAGSMKASLHDAQLSADQVDHVNAHATATRAGDVQEAIATSRVFGDNVPVTAFKGLTGHTLGAAGAIESIYSILMLRGGFIPATKNLHEPDPELPALRHVIGDAYDAKLSVAMVNNFAFGGINTSLIFGKI